MTGNVTDENLLKSLKRYKKEFNDPLHPSMFKVDLQYRIKMVEDELKKRGIEVPSDE